MVPRAALVAVLVVVSGCIIPRAGTREASGQGGYPSQPGAQALGEAVKRMSGERRGCGECPRGQVCDTETGECVADSEIPPPEPAEAQP